MSGEFAWMDTFGSVIVGKFSGRCLTALVLGTATAGAFSTSAVGSLSTHPASRPSAAVTTSGYPYARQCPGAGANDVVDRWKLSECNCTSYVAWTLQTNRQRTDWFVPGAMDAQNWPAVAGASGLRVGRRPAVGAIAVWPEVAPPFGHVAYVTGIHGSRYFDVAEYNLPAADGGSKFGFDTRHGLTTGDEVSFVYVPRRPSPPTHGAS